VDVREDGGGRKCRLYTLGEYQLGVGGRLELQESVVNEVSTYHFGYFKCRQGDAIKRKKEPEYRPKD